MPAAAQPKVLNPDATLQAAGYFTNNIPVDNNNFGPRIGFAWTPKNDNRTVVRHCPVGPRGRPDPCPQQRARAGEDHPRGLRVRCDVRARHTGQEDPGDQRCDERYEGPGRSVEGVGVSGRAGDDTIAEDPAHRWR